MGDHPLRLGIRALLLDGDFSTNGYGDIVPSSGWRVLAALEGVNGFVLIGWSTAYLVSASTHVGPFRAGKHL